ncbi:MAG: hypothetical protein AABZ40_03260 [Thermodesulfobacteriota bacterium]
MLDPVPVMINFLSELVEAELSTMKDVRRKILEMKMKYRKKSFINPSSFPPTPLSPSASSIRNLQISFQIDPELAATGGEERRVSRSLIDILHALGEVGIDPQEFPDLIGEFGRVGRLQTDAVGNAAEALIRTSFFAVRVYEEGSCVSRGF